LIKLCFLRWQGVGGLEKNPDSVYLTPRFVVLSARYLLRVELYFFLRRGKFATARRHKAAFLSP
jgi:hypothetical protein